MSAPVYPEAPSTAALMVLSLAIVGILLVLLVIAGLDPAIQD
jgi:hypothetical protein